MALCLFFSAWQVGERGRLQSRDYDRTEGVIRPRPEHSKNKHGRVQPVEGELATILERQWLAWPVAWIAPTSSTRREAGRRLSQV